MTTGGKKILFLMQVIGHPRDSKRIKMLQDAGYHVDAAAFERDYRGGRPPSCGVAILGKLQHGKYFLRLFKFLKAVPAIRSALARCDVVYASGQDMAFLAFISGIGLGKPIAMEVGDLVRLQVRSGLRGNLVRTVDRWITAQYKLLVVISEGFLDVYYRKWLRLATPGLVIQNKLEWAQSNQKSRESPGRSNGVRPLAGRPLKIGYFGLLRDAWSWQVLNGLVRTHPARFEVVFAGLPIVPPDLAEQVANTPGLTYLGEYRSPERLPEIYDAVDMIWACYPAMDEDDWNMRWGRPNRFYESCYFRKPCFARAGSLFASDVERYEIGSVIDMEDVQETIEFIAKIGVEDYELWCLSMSALPPETYLYTNERKLLSSAIENL